MATSVKQTKNKVDIVNHNWFTSICTTKRSNEKQTEVCKVI